MDFREFEAFVAATMAEENIPGLAVAVSRHGETIYSKGFGVKDIATQEAVTPHTVFGTASVTKSFTALAIMKMCAQGLLSVEDAVIWHLPELVVPGISDMSKLKVRHLLSHTTGVPPLRRRQDIEGFAEHMDFIAHEEFKLLGEPGDYLSYSNDLFLVLGAIIERISGRKYRDYIQEEIIEPLGMNNSTIHHDRVACFADITIPYMYNKETCQPEAKPWPVLNNYEVGGGVRSCVSDLLKYGAAYFSNIIVPQEVSAMMYRPVYAIGRNSSYGFALKVTPNHAGVTLVEHGGAQAGVSANFGFVPEAGLVVAVLCNVTGASASRIWLAAVNTALGHPLSYSTDIETAAASLPDDVMKYAATCCSAEGGRICVNGDTTGLRITFEGEEYDLHYAHDEVFFFNYRGQKVVRFYLDGEGLPWAAFVGLRMLVREE
ncbi:MAG TPA: serine hydrolase domain-containing protein [Bacillota bacterium]|nr:serine hydrolase domain-containing protein [Bacillota bacterium]